ncbi:MAG: adenosylcobalamin-dependent ribonucleoside-diphosphate reductase [Thermoproteota archaeon]|nr:MAG: adenosylcobalamin-dependent ribonucleoside-diphosphate reductase [Candidatus Korarchaeota archaeon]
MPNILTGGGEATKVKKRDGRIERYRREKIESAIRKAVDAVREKVDIDTLVDDVEEKIKGRKIITVEEIQDVVESVLVEHKLYKVAKAYILYRKKRAEIRKVAATLGITDTFHLPLNSLQVLAARYLRRDEQRRIIETPGQLFQRVAKAVAVAEKRFGRKEDVSYWTDEFYEAMTTFKFMPNSPTLMNAGTKLGQLSACFVLPVGDSIESIFDAVKWTALVHKSGGGTGFSFSRLRPAGDTVQTTGGIASGPVSFMKVFNAATEIIKQGGKRRGANMGVLKVTHPDILDFVVAKTTEGELENFNISVGATDEFMDAVRQDGTVQLINPRTGRVVRSVKARVIWDLIITEAWKTGDPGMLFLDTINNSESNCIPKYGPIEATNPCGEVPLYPFEACNLGSINLSEIVDDGKIDWNELERLVKIGVRFLDDVIEVNRFPLRQIERMVRRTRRIGLGVMGFADMLVRLGISYHSNEALKVAEEVMKFIQRKAREESVKLASERGSFPDFEDSIWVERGFKQLRNCCCTTIAPTGTISIIAGGCSSGIEPLFAVAYIRNVSDSLGTNLFEVNPTFEEIAIQEGFYSDELVKKIARQTSIQHIEEIPEEIRRLFVTAHDIPPLWHVKMQAAFQRYVDNAISKTINFPETATPRDIEMAYMMAWQLGCKGITVYRDKCKRKQVLCVECEERR